MEDDNIECEEEQQPKCTIATKNVYGTRHTLAIMLFLSMVFLYGMRVNLSVAIVAMVQKYPGGHFTNDTEIEDNCPVPTPNHDDNNDVGDVIITNDIGGEFLWDEKTQGLILGAFYYSYGIANIIGGRASDHFGGRWLIGVGILANAFFTLLTPVASRLGVAYIVGIRVLEGCMQGVVLPATNKLITNWYTTKERSKFTGLIYTGLDFGSVLTFSLSGWLCESGFLGGWPSAFYVPGTFAVIWVIFWFVLIRDNPKKHPRISEEELKYILKGRPDSEETYPIPWTSIFTSIPFWVTVIAQSGTNYGYFVLLTQLPTYLNNILHVSLHNNGIITAAPYVATCLFSIVFSFSVDKAISTGKLSILSVRRLAVAISCYGPMLCLIGMCFVNCSIEGAFAILFTSGTLSGAAYCGVFTSYSDIGPRFAGTLMGLGCAFGGIGGFIGPAITGIITDGNQTIDAWRIVFIICAIIYGISATVYIIFITTEPQPWNEPQRSIKQKENESILQEKFLQNDSQLNKTV